MQVADRRPSARQAIAEPLPDHYRVVEIARCSAGQHHIYAALVFGKNTVDGGLDMFRTDHAEAWQAGFGEQGIGLDHGHKFTGKNVNEWGCRPRHARLAKRCGRRFERQKQSMDRALIAGSAPTRTCQSTGAAADCAKSIQYAGITSVRSPI